MRFDAVVIGAELDAWLAALRLLEHGRRVCVLASGAGSLHYAPGGLRVLGRVDGVAVESPLAQIERLHERHPYRLAGQERCEAALRWYGETLANGLCPRGDNTLVVTPAGLELPVLHADAAQARSGETGGRKVAILGFSGHRDFPAGLAVAQLRRSGGEVEALELPAPDERTDSAAIACAFDDLDKTAAWCVAVRGCLPAGARLLLLPAVLGLTRAPEVLALVEERLGLAVREIATLPPCLPGMRLAAELETRVRVLGGVVRSGVRPSRSERQKGRVVALVDGHGRAVEADVFVVATGGVLMGGLEVASDGAVVETALGLAVSSAEPLATIGREATLAALHATGVVADGEFRAHDNVFVTGRTLAHYDPARELSAEGVSIVSAWTAAQAAHAMLGG